VPELFGISLSQFIDGTRPGLDWFVFRDWRRRLEDSVSFFLTKFLPHFAVPCTLAVPIHLMIYWPASAMVINPLRQFSPCSSNDARHHGIVAVLQL
jgi:hypothetical protein